jgi:AcrR family transcriptional regulator
MDTDLRVIRTKDAIREAFVELMEEKGFEAITVKDITTRAKINRGTFYSHYQDKFDLMMRCQEEILAEMTDIAKHNFPKVISELSTHSPTLTTIVVIFEYLNENSRFMKAVLGPKGDVTFQTKLKDFMWKTLIEKNPNPLVKEKDLLVPGQYLISYISSAYIGVIQQWLNIY